MRHQNNGLRKLCGCQRRIWATCPDPWHFNFKWQNDVYRFSLERCVGRLVRRTTKKGQVVWSRDLTSLGDWINDKTAARVEADRLRVEIQKGTFRQASPLPSAELTLTDVATKYRARHVNAPMRRKKARYAMGLHLDRLCEAMVPAAGGTIMRLGDKPMAAVTKADVEFLRDERRASYAGNRALADAFEAWEQLEDVERASTPRPPRPPRTRAAGTVQAGTKLGEVGINRLLARLRHLFSWAICEGHVTETPFRRHGVTMIKLEKKAEAPRTRRLEPGEYEALRAAAEPHMRALIEAELSTGCRIGELLALQWNRIRFDDKGQAQWIVLGADDTKTSEARTIPIGERLRAELDMRRHDPAGKLHGPEAFVFGNELGEAIDSIKTAWRGTCRRAKVHGLHFHDLRREFASTLAESGADLHDIQLFLGHANITTTSRYLKSTPLRLARALAKMEAITELAIPSSTDRCNPVAIDNDEVGRKVVN